MLNVSRPFPSLTRTRATPSPSNRISSVRRTAAPFSAELDLLWKLHFRPFGLDPYLLFVSLCGVSVSILRFDQKPPLLVCGNLGRNECDQTLRRAADDAELGRFGQRLEVSCPEGVNEYFELEIALAECLYLHTWPAGAHITQNDGDGVSFPQGIVQHIDSDRLPPMANITAPIKAVDKPCPRAGTEMNCRIVRRLGIVELNFAPVAHLPEGQLDRTALVDPPSAHPEGNPPRARFSRHDVAARIHGGRSQFIFPVLLRPIG